jgi:hypothetical protein
MASRKMKQKDPGTNPGGISEKPQRAMKSEKNKMADQGRRPDKGSKILKGSRRRAG